MINIKIRLKKNHIDYLLVDGHALINTQFNTQSNNQNNDKSIDSLFSIDINTNKIKEKGWLKKVFAKKMQNRIRSGKNGHETHTEINNNQQLGSIACAAISILCKSFIETIVLYSQQKNLPLENFMVVQSSGEGNLEVSMLPPTNEPMEVHRYAIEQMFIVGLQAVAQECQNDIQLKIEQ